MSARKRKLFNLSDDLDGNEWTSFDDSSKSSRLTKLSSRSMNERNHTISNEETLFEELMNKAGIFLSTGTSPNKIGMDQAIFQRNLQKLLKNHIRYPKVVQDFLRDFSSYIEDKKKLEFALMPTVTTADCESARGRTQDTVIRILLGVETIQTLCISKLLEKATEISVQDENDEPSPLANMILCQLRWLSNIIDSKALADKMLEMLELMPLANQKQMILLFPETLNDSDHPYVAKQLCELLLINRDLTVDIVESLSLFCIKTEVLAEVKQSVLKMLQAADMKSLPTLIKFLLQDLDQFEAVDTVNELRTKVTFTIPTARTSQRNNQTEASERGIDLCILDTILYCCEREKSVYDAWVKEIEQVKTSEDHNPLDVLVLLSLHTVNQYQKNITILIKAKIKSKCLSTNLVRKAVKEHINVIKEYFESIQILITVLLRSVDPVLSEFGTFLCLLTFEQLDRYYQQKIIFDLLALVSSDLSIDVNAGLETLSLIAKEQAKSLAPFANFLKTLLDHLESMNLSQTRQVYFILNQLVYRGGQQGRVIEDEMSIILRKQLTHSSTSYQKIGVVGALEAVKAMSGDMNELEGQNGERSKTARMSLADLQVHRSRASLDPAMSKQSVELLNQALQAANKTPSVLSLYWDELTRALEKGELDNTVEEWIDELLGEKFANDFVADYKPNMFEASDLAVLFNLEPFSEDSLVLNLTPLIHKDDAVNVGRDRISVLTLASQFRLLRISTHFRNNGVLEDVDALLSCGISMPVFYESSNLSSLSLEQRNLLCTATFHCINWFREVLNAFSCASEMTNEMKAHVLHRLRLLVEMEKKFQEFLAATPNFLIPTTSYDMLSVKSTGAQKLAAKPRGQVPKKSKKNLETESEGVTQKVSQSMATAGPSTAKTQARKESEKDKGANIAAVYKPFLREIDLSACAMFEYGLSLNNSDEESELKLTAKELLYLLEDLVCKLEAILLTSGPKRKTVFATKRSTKALGHSNLFLYTPLEVANVMISILPIFCSLLEDCSAYFQAQMNNNDGLLDGPGSDDELSVTVSVCMLSILKIINALLSWNGFSGVSNKELLNNVMGILGSRLVVNEETGGAESEKFKRAFRYIAKFEASLPSLNCSVALVRLLNTIANMCGDSSTLVESSEMAEMLLQRSWSSVFEANDKGAKHNEKINQLLGVYLVQAKDILQCLKSLTSGPMKELAEDESKTAQSVDFPTLNVSTFTTYYKAMLEHLVSHVKTLDPRKGKPTTTMKAAILEKWTTAVEIYSTLVHLIKRFDGRLNLLACLKNSTPFLDHFLKNCMPLIDKTFRTNQEQVKNVIKVVQQSTRYLHSICSHTKCLKDTTLVKYVPGLKKIIEEELTQFKAMMAANNCSNAFWIGNLKNRDLKGEEILSQSSVADSETEDDDDEGTATEPLPSDGESRDY